jgi:hypothetical protein
MKAPEREECAVTTFILNLLEETVREARPDLSEEEADKAKMQLLRSYFGPKWFGVVK